jgi:regulator of RNase E activity RraA
MHGLKPLLAGRTICGPAFTVSYAPLGVEHATVGDFLDDVPSGGVVVISNQGRTDCTVWGDIMSVTAVSKGIEATVIDGVCRDVDGIQRESYPVFSRGVYMVTGKDRVFMDSCQEPVTMAGVLVHPGDLIFGDDSGVLRIPSGAIEEVLETAEQIAAREAEIVTAIREGLSLREARAQNGYHKLQTSEAK